jgi:hypothetical protein
MRRSALLSLVLALAPAACADSTKSPTAVADEASSAAATAQAVGTLHSLMRPENEPPVAGDPVHTSVARASGRVRLTEDGQVEFKLSVDNPARETFVAAHIHEAPVGTNGGIVVGFFGPPTRPGSTPVSDARFELTGTATGPDFNNRPDPADQAALLERIRTNPASFYLNLHTTDDPIGATRGQFGSNPPRLGPLTAIGSDIAAALGLPAHEMVQFRLRNPGFQGPWQVRVDWGDDNVTYTTLNTPFFGWFIHDYAAPGTYQIQVQGGQAIGPASAVRTAEIVVQ